MKTLPKIENMTKGQALEIASNLTSNLESYIQEIEKSSINRFSKIIQIFKWDFTRQNIQSRIDTARVDSDFDPLREVLQDIIKSFDLVKTNLEVLRDSNRAKDTPSVVSNETPSLMSEDFIKRAQNGILGLIPQLEDNTEKEKESKDVEKDKLEKSYYRSMLSWIGWNKAKESIKGIGESIKRTRGDGEKNGGGVIRNTVNTAKNLVRSMLDNILDFPQTVSNMLKKGLTKFVDGFTKFFDFAITAALVSASGLLKLVFKGLLRGPLLLIGMALFHDGVKDFLKNFVKNMFGEGVISKIFDKIMDSNILAGATTGAGIGALIGGPIGALIGSIIGGLGTLIYNKFKDGSLSKFVDKSYQWFIKKAESALGFVKKYLLIGINKIADGMKFLTDKFWEAWAGVVHLAGKAISAIGIDSGEIDSKISALQESNKKLQETLNSNSTKILELQNLKANAVNSGNQDLANFYQSQIDTLNKSNKEISDKLDADKLNAENLLRQRNLINNWGWLGKIQVAFENVVSGLFETFTGMTIGEGAIAIRNMSVEVSEKISIGFKKITDGIRSIVDMISDFFDWVGNTLKNKYDEAKKWVYDNTVGWFTKKEKDKKVIPPKDVSAGLNITELQANSALAIPNSFSTQAQNMPTMPNEFGIPDIPIVGNVETQNTDSIRVGIAKQVPVETEIRSRIAERLIEERMTLEKKNEMRAIINGGTVVSNRTSVQQNHKSTVTIRPSPIDQSLYGSGVRSW